MASTKKEFDENLFRYFTKGRERTFRFTCQSSLKINIASFPVFSFNWQSKILKFFKTDIFFLVYNHFISDRYSVSLFHNDLKMATRSWFSLNSFINFCITNLCYDQFSLRVDEMTIYGFAWSPQDGKFTFTLN